jgi:DnaJ-class molecular chaperone
LAEAHQQIARLEEELETAQQAVQTHMYREIETRGHPVFRRVGLDQDCPRWVAEFVRREFRRRLHPDTKAPTQKAEAERRFKQAEEVFSEIWRLRGF